MKGVSNLGPRGDALACNLCICVQEGKKKLGEKHSTNRCLKKNPKPTKNQQNNCLVKKARPILALIFLFSH